MALEELLNKLPDRMYTSKKNDNHIFTPFNVAKEMIEALPDDIWSTQTTFLDICCKSGIFLYLIYEKLMNSIDMIKEIPDEKDRKQYIIEKQLFGICPDTMCKLASTRILCGAVNANCNIISLDNNYTNIITNTDKSFLYETLKREFNGMKRFGVVISNPPYNRGGGDIDFVDLGFELCDKYTCMITPAKWQTAEADQKIASKMSYGEFRQKIVPHMSKVVFYPCCKDVFDILQVDGITHYIIDKNKTHEKCVVENVCKNIKEFDNSVIERDITKRQSLLNIGDEIVNYLGEYNVFKLHSTYYLKKYQVWTNTQTPGGNLSTVVSTRKTLFIGESVLEEDIGLNLEHSNVEICSFTSDDKNECDSFISWLNCKFTRFFTAINQSKLTGIITNDCLRFIPAPPSGKFDHLYTDEEPYKAFNLPQKYIDVIEAVIKERK